MGLGTIGNFKSLLLLLLFKILNVSAIYAASGYIDQNC